MTVLSTDVVKMRLGDLRPLDRNARFMTHETFQRLVANIRNDGCLTQVPLVYYDRGDDEQPVILSGNHRVSAGIEALGVDHEDWVMIARGDLNAARQLAIQLSHNAIAGQDDPGVLASLYAEIDDVDLMQYAGLDDKTLGLLADVDVISLTEANLDYQTIAFTFLPDEKDTIGKALDAATIISAKQRYVASMALYDRFRDALDTIARAHGIKNISTALELLCRLFEHHATDLADGYLDVNGDPTHDGWVPLWTVFGTDSCPAAVAAVVHQAIARLIKRDQVDTNARIHALELIAADYLAGP